MKIFLCFYTTYFFDKLWNSGFSSSSWNDAKWPPKNLSVSNQIQVTFYITFVLIDVFHCTQYIDLDLKFVKTYTLWVFKQTKTYKNRLFWDFCQHLASDFIDFWQGFGCEKTRFWGLRLQFINYEAETSLIRKRMRFRSRYGNFQVCTQHIFSEKIWKHDIFGRDACVFIIIIK